MDLKKLPKEHPLRNTPLGDIGARYRGRDSNVWQPVRPAYSIAKFTFNDLGDVWLADEWEATKYSEDWETETRSRAIAQNGNVGYE